MAEARETYEKRDISVRAVMWFAIALVILAVIMNIGLWLFEVGLNRIYPRGPAASRITLPRISPPAPQLQTNPTADMQELRAAEDATLNSYGWVDRQAGIVRIPIDRAMELSIQRGLPARQQPQATP